MSNHNAMIKTANVKKFNDMGAESYDTVYCKYQETMAEKIVDMHKERLDRGETITVLDLAGGSGQLAEALKKLNTNVKVVGVDMAGGMIDTPEAKGRYDEAYVADVTGALNQLGYEKFDVVTIASSIEFITTQDMPALVTNFEAHIKDGGHIYSTFRPKTTSTGLEQRKVTEGMEFHTPKIVEGYLSDGFKRVHDSIETDAYPFKANNDTPQDVELQHVIWRAPSLAA